jgi:hypothetical protein
MLYDCFTFFNELELLQMRLKALDPIADYFVIVEATKTHSGQEKRLVFDDNKKYFSKYHDKIIHIIVDSYPEYENSWTYENHQRNQIIRGLTHCTDDDLILISDLDEIPNPDQIPLKVRDGQVMRFLQHMYFYYANIYKKNHMIWEGGSVITNYKTIRLNLLKDQYIKHNIMSFPAHLNEHTSITKIRLYRKNSYIQNGGWHLSYLGGSARIIYKLKSFSHQEIISTRDISESQICQDILKGVDLFEPKTILLGVDRDDLPAFISNGLSDGLYFASPKKEPHFRRYIRRKKEIISIILRNTLRQFLYLLK